MWRQYQDFNPRSHEGSDIRSHTALVKECIFQSTLPRRERPEFLALSGLRFGISIHAPTKGATEDIPNKFSANDISIHAPTKGATNMLRKISSWLKHFNPRSHEGSDVSSSTFAGKFLVFQSTLPRRERLYNRISSFACFEISIHAPTKGATLFVILLEFIKPYFNPRSHEGSDEKSV